MARRPPDAPLSARAMTALLNQISSTIGAMNQSVLESYGDGMLKLQKLEAAVYELRAAQYRMETEWCCFYCAKSAADTPEGRLFYRADVQGQYACASCAGKSPEWQLPQRRAPRKAAPR